MNSKHIEMLECSNENKGLTFHHRTDQLESFALHGVKTPWLTFPVKVFLANHLQPLGASRLIQESAAAKPRLCSFLAVGAGCSSTALTFKPSPAPILFPERRQIFEAFSERAGDVEGSSLQNLTQDRRDKVEFSV